MTNHLFPCLFILIFFTVACAEEKDPGILFEQGKYEKAYRMWQPLANNGDRVAQNYLGIHHYLGLGMERNFRLAKEWFEKAAMNGLSDAQYNLGVMYENGEYVQKDYLTAYMWFVIADRNGNSHAARRMQGIADEHKLFPNQIMRAESLAKKYAL